MARQPSPHPTDAELKILRVLWNAGPSSLGRIHDALCDERAVAKTTVATMLGIMLGKGLVRRAEGQRGYLWSAAVSRNSAASGMVSKLIDRVFDGSAQQMVAHLIQRGHLDPEELEELRRLLNEHHKDRKTKTSRGES